MLSAPLSLHVSLRPPLAPRSAHASPYSVTPAFSSFPTHRLLAHSAHAPLLVITIFSSLNTSLYSTSHSVNQSINRFWATVCKTVRRMLSVRCLSVCPVCNVRALWPNGWTDQDETWHAGRPRHGHIVIDGDPATPPSNGHSSPIFGPYLFRPNGCMDQDVTWYGAIGLGPGDFVLDGDPAPCPTRGQSSLPNFRPISIVAKRLDG